MKLNSTHENEEFFFCTYKIPFDAGRKELYSNITNFRIKHIDTVIVQARMQFNRWIFWSRVRCDFNEITYFIFYRIAQLECSDHGMASHLNAIADGELFWIIVTTSYIK